ncbi:MAG: SDR family oxidoreductase, partial [Bacteroidales bacterium]|nr:SDR family oxidoreductase [Bacteroidales bacterium]
MKDKVIIITGASSGIGEALAINLASKGARVVLAARNIEKLKNTEKVIIAKGTTALSVETDVSKEEDCRRLIEITVKHFGRIDILINNAGISMRAAFNELDSKVIHKLMDVNFWGTFYCSKFAYPYLLASKGSLIAVSSIAGYKGLPGRTGYSASKFAIHGLFDVLRIEALKTGLHIMLACPGYTATNIRYNALTKDGSQQGASPLAEAQL